MLATAPLRARTATLIPALLAALLGASATFAQTTAPATAPSGTLPAAKTVIDRAVAAMGGKAALDKVESIRFKCSLESPQGPMVMDLFWAKPDRALMRVNVMGMQIEQGVNGNVAWGLNPMSGQPELMEGERAENLKDQTSMHLMFTKVTERFRTVETVGRNEFEGRPCFTVRCADGREGEGEMRIHFDAETGLPAGLETTSKTPMGEQPVKQIIRTWEKTAGLTLFRSLVIESGPQGRSTMTVSEVELNKVDPALFTVPPAIQAEADRKAKAPAPTSQPARP